jgi:hypothetical protein
MLKKQPSPNAIYPLNKGAIVFCERNRPRYLTRKIGKRKEGYFSGTYIEDRDAPIPGVPCLTGLFVIANSPR